MQFVSVSEPASLALSDKINKSRLGAGLESPGRNMSSYNNHSGYDYGYGSYPPNGDDKGFQQPYNNNYGYSYQNISPQNMAQQQPYLQQSPNANSVPLSSAADFLGPELLSNPAAQIGLHVGSQALSAGQSYVNRNVPTRCLSLT
jgi:hypothetical protein